VKVTQIGFSLTEARVCASACLSLSFKCYPSDSDLRIHRY